jgi:predicted nucleic acid-binding Zn ribbon protein
LYYCSHSITMAEVVRETRCADEARRRRRRSTVDS